METISKQQIVCVFDTNDTTPIFDKDDWDNDGSNYQTEKQIILTQNKNANQNIINKVNQEIQKSKENFFKVNVIKKTTQKPVQSKPTSSSIKNILPTIIKANKNSILLQGYLDKKTDGFFFKWHRRYFTLTCQKLYFFQNQKKIQIVGCINLKLLPTKIQQNKNQIILDFSGECENIILKADKQSQLKQWKQWIKQVIDYQAKQNKIMIKTMVKPLYDSKQSITEKQLLQTAQTGDILLFYTKNTGAQLQRFFTNSDFDHVAMVVKFGKHDLMVFESNQMYGVSIYDWKQYVQYFNLYEKITLRKLNYIKKADAQRQLLNFVKKNLGKNYQINMNKLITLESDVNWDNINKQKNVDRGYFCSELIAKALKSIGLLDAKKSSGRYWPVDFAEKSGLLLKKGAFLGREEVIILNKHLKNYI